MLLLAFYISLGHSLESYESVLFYLFASNFVDFGIGSTCTVCLNDIGYLTKFKAIFMRITINRETATSTAYLLFP